MNKKPWYKNWIVWVAIVIVLGVIGMFMPKSEEQKQAEIETEQAIADAEQAAEEAQAEAEKAAQEYEQQREEKKAQKEKEKAEKEAAEKAEEEAKAAEAERIANLPTLQDLIAKNHETNAPQQAEILIVNNPEIVEAIVNNDGTNDILVVHAQYEDGGVSNESRIKSTYHLVDDLIRNQGADAFGEIQFWAEEPLMSSVTGEDAGMQKVISYTLNGDVIKGFKNQVILPTNVEEKGVLEDYWIHPALAAD